MNNPVELLDLFDRFVAKASVYLAPASLQPLQHAAARMRRRRHFAGITALVGLAGGTGSGKSSLLNALSGTDLALVGAQRPTTSRPLVLVPEASGTRLVHLWEELAISDVASSRSLDYVLLDLPDLDSLDPSHRSQVDRILLDLDVVVWVTDPEKYHDRVLHEEFLRPLAAHAGRFVFALNQIDRLDPAEIDDVVADLSWALRRDGFEDPEVFPVAADPVLGPPFGIDELEAVIRRAIYEQGNGEIRIRVEIERLIRQLDADLAPLDFNQRWGAVCDAAAQHWPQSEQAVVAFVDSLRVEARELEGVEPLEIIGAAPAGPSREVRRHLDLTLGRHLRELLRPRAETRAIATELQLALSQNRQLDN